MSRFRLTIGLKLALPQMHAACLSAISGLEWTVTGIAEMRITCQEALEEDTTALSPVRVAVVFAEDGDERTEVTLHGVSFGNDPLQTARVRERVEQLLTAIARETGDSLLIEARVERMPQVLRPPEEPVTARLPLHLLAVAR